MANNGYIFRKHWLLNIILIVFFIIVLFIKSDLWQTISLLLFFSIIGIPVVVLFFISPGILLFLLLLRTSLFIFHKLKEPTIWVASSILTAFILIVTPFIVNSASLDNAKKVLSNDFNDIKAKPKIETLAVLNDGESNHREECGDFCQRALLTGSVKRFLVVRHPSDWEKLNRSATGALYWLGPGEICPRVNLHPGIGILKVQDHGDKAGRSPGDLMGLKVNSGNCLFKKTSEISVADAVVRQGKVDRRILTHRNYDIVNPFESRLTARQIQFYQKQNGSMELRYQETKVRLSKLMPVLFPMVVGDKGKAGRIGYWSKTVPHGGSSPRFFEKFLEDVLKFDLALSYGSWVSNVRISIRQKLESSEATISFAPRILDEFLETATSEKEIAGADVQLILSIMDDRRIDVPRLAYTVVSTTVRKDPGLADEFAAVLFSRLSDYLEKDEADVTSQFRTNLRHIGEGISALPGTAVEPYWAELHQLAGSETERKYAVRAFGQLPVFRLKAMPTLFHLLDAASASNSWELMKTALKGLCRIGPEGKSGIPQLLSRLDAGTIKLNDKYGYHRAISTLASLGASKEEILEYFAEHKKTYSYGDFGTLVDNALVERKCAF